MAKKKAGAAVDPTREKAKQLREAQAKADKRTRNIIITLVGVLILAIVVAIVFVVVNRPTPEKHAADLPAQFSEGQPIIVSSEGVGVENPAAENLTLYFDYTCSACTQLELALRPHLIDAALAGDYNLELQPVITSGGAYNVAATAASLVVAAEAPDLFLPLHEALTDYFYESAISAGDTTYQNLSASDEKVAEIASEVGVPEDLIAKFNSAAASAYLDKATQTWIDADIADRTQVATPEFVAHNTNIDYAGDSAEEVMALLKEAVAK